MSSTAEGSTSTALPPTSASPPKRRLAVRCFTSASAAIASVQLNSARFAADDGVEAALRLLDVIARSGNDARARDVLATRGSTMFQATITDLLDRRHRTAPIARPGRGRGDRYSSATRRDCSLAALASPSATPTRSFSKRMVRAASDAGAGGIRTAPGRAVMIIGLTHPSLPLVYRGCRRTRLHRQRRRPAPACLCLRRRADLLLRAYRGTRDRPAYHRSGRALSRRVVPDSFVGLRQGMRARGQHGAHHRRRAMAVRAYRRWLRARHSVRHRPTG